MVGMATIFFFDIFYFIFQINLFFRYHVYFLRLQCITGLWKMFRTFVLRCDWSILRILKSTKKHERQSERVTLVSIYNNSFRLNHN